MKQSAGGERDERSAGAKNSGAESAVNRAAAGVELVSLHGLDRTVVAVVVHPAADRRKPDHTGRGNRRQGLPDLLAPFSFSGGANIVPRHLRAPQRHSYSFLSFFV